jgi:WD40 repeat protein
LAVLSDERVVAGSLNGEIRVFDPYWRSSRRPVSEADGVSALFVAEEPGGGGAVTVDVGGGLLREFSGPTSDLVLGSAAPAEVWTAGTIVGEQVALASEDRLIKLFDLRSGSFVRELRGHDGEILSLASDADGYHLLSGARDRTAILWSGLLGEDPQSWVVEHPRAVSAVALASDSRAFATADSGNTLRLFSVDARSEAMSWQVSGLGKLQGLAISPSGEQVAAGLKFYARLYSSSGAEMSSQFGPHDTDVRCLVFSGDGQRLFAGDANGKIYVWDLAGSESLIELEGHSAGIVSLAFADDGRTLLSADESGAVLSWHSEFDAARYEIWSDSERHPLRAKRIIEFFGGDIFQAAAELTLGYPGLKPSDPAVELIMDLARDVSRPEAPVEGD